jgi:dTDP-4-dehydrorhamnose reductase
MRILVLGASGMLGNAMVRVLAEKKDFEVYGTVRASSVCGLFSEEIASRLITGCDVGDHDALVKAFSRVRPEVVINCIGLVKQVADAEDPLQAIRINALLPHQLAGMCSLAGARLVHISTDCVFSGDRGGYSEADQSDARDLYGKSKFLGEVNYQHAITLRTSIIGHELLSAHGLIEWFLSRQGQCKGFTKAIFSGLPTAVLAQVIRDVVIPRPSLHGVYHVASEPISKYQLLKLVAEIYGKSIEILPDDSLVIDRSLNAERFGNATGYLSPSWPDLVREMKAYQYQLNTNYVQ